MSEINVEAVNLPQDSSAPGVRIDSLLLAPNPSPGTLHALVIALNTAIQNLASPINDGITDAATTWSSFKIAAELQALGGASSVADGILTLEQEIDATHVLNERAISINPIVNGHVTVNGIWIIEG